MKMKVYLVAIFLGYISMAESYTKYGRSCKDIGCPGNQQCIMETDPCSYHQRQGECGSYPTCKKISNSGARTCSTYVCPPTKVCKMDGDTPKCVDSQIKGVATYDTQNTNHLSAQNDGGAQPSGNIYPNLPRGETTARPNIYRPQSGGAGYQGGSVGSGYPGYPQQPASGGYQQPAGGYQQPAGGYQQPAGGYQQTGGGYQQPGAYPGGYPQQGRYPQGGYTQGGYQGQGGYQPYPGYQGGYQGRYQGGQQGGYQQGYGQNQYGQKSTGTSFTDQITGSLKSIGLFCVILKYLMSRMYGL